ncbi:hypothetical protein KA405_02210 [Patescibacteria group bacterium]|nr:hypothetical protein [Patescibacteria group bacterium]
MNVEIKEFRMKKLIKKYPHKEGVNVLKIIVNYIPPLSVGNCGACSAHLGQHSNHMRFHSLIALQFELLQRDSFGEIE